jgi:uncharacterized protein (UPF0332 family)
VNIQLFDPMNIYQFTKELEGFDSQFVEAKERAIVSRVYYSIFLTIRELLRKEVKNTPAEPLYDQLYKDAYIHAVVIESLAQCDVHSKSLLSSLRKNRNEADYNIDTKNYGSVRDNFSNAEELTKRYTDISQGFKSNSYEIQEIISKWFKIKDQKKAFQTN